jgi:hypothetical protein
MVQLCLGRVVRRFMLVARTLTVPESFPWLTDNVARTSISEATVSRNLYLCCTVRLLRHLDRQCHQLQQLPTQSSHLRRQERQLAQQGHFCCCHIRRLSNPRLPSSAGHLAQQWPRGVQAGVVIASSLHRFCSIGRKVRHSVAGQLLLVCRTRLCHSTAREDGGAGGRTCPCLAPGSLFLQRVGERQLCPD